MVGSDHFHHLRATMIDILLPTMIVVITDIRLVVNNSHLCLEVHHPYPMVLHHLYPLEAEKVGVEVVVGEEAVVFLMPEILLRHLTRPTVMLLVVERRNREIAVARTDIANNFWGPRRFLLSMT